MLSRISILQVIRVLLATAVVATPPIIFEKITYYYYAIASPAFGTFSGHRFWFDIVWFCIAGAVAAVMTGRSTRFAIIAPVLGSLVFTIVMYVPPFCTIKECYMSSPDGLGPLRDFLFFASLATVSCAASIKSWRSEKKSRIDAPFQLGVTMLAGFALSFFPVAHIFAGVTVDYPLNYLQWFLAGAPAGLAGSMWLLDRGTLRGIFPVLFAGLSGVAFAIAVCTELPCPDCGSYWIPIASILLLAFTFSLPAVLLEARRSTGVSSRFYRAPGIITTVTIILTITLLLSLSFTGEYQMSVVNGFPGVTNSNYSALEVGRTFVYSGGYLNIPRVTSESVGINISFANTTISKYPDNFLAAGVGDQSPNCCKDGLDLAYRADVIEFSNGTEAVLARAWWACDYVMACGGYSWQQMLHFGSQPLPDGALENWIELQMNWTSTHIVEWFYRIHFTSNGSSSPWIMYSSFVPPTIQNHYWDAGLLGAGNFPINYALFYQFGVSSAYPISSKNWQVLIDCPNIVLNGTRNCVSAVSYVNGLHSFWKALYTFGETYQGMTFSYRGGYEVEFYYSGHSPSDETVIWK